MSGEDNKTEISRRPKLHEVAKQRNHVITISSLFAGGQVSFPAFLTEFDDNYAVSWGQEQIFGRSDPIQTYQGTTRKISIAFDVLADDLAQARKNMEKFTILTQMMYPAYSEELNNAPSGTRTIMAPPILKIKFSNLIKSSADVDGSLLGAISGFSFKPNLEAGFFIDYESPESDILPKILNISFTFDPQHQSTLGKDSTGKFLTPGFPYGIIPPGNPTSG